MVLIQKSVICTFSPDVSIMVIYVKLKLLSFNFKSYKKTIKTETVIN